MKVGNQENCPEQLMAKRKKSSSSQDAKKSSQHQMTLDKFFGFTTSTTVTSMQASKNDGDDDGDVEIVEVSKVVASSSVQKTDRRLPSSMTATANLVDADTSAAISKPGPRFSSPEALEASYNKRQINPSAVSICEKRKLAPIFERMKREKIATDAAEVDIVNDSFYSMQSDANERLEAVVSDCCIVPLVTLPNAPDCTAKRCEFNNSNDIPFSHIVPGTSYVVDYFDRNNNNNSYSSVFLSHFHYDHYKNLSNAFSKNIYCSEDTARLVLANFPKLGQKREKQVIGLPLEEWTVVNGIPVILLEAFHCPGAVCFVFRTPGNKFCFHSGDFRAGLFIQRYAAALKSLCHLNTVFIDTTYCNPEYDFAPQSTIIRAVMETCLKGPKPIVCDSRCLVVVGTYTIGKECVFAALGRLLNTPVCVAAAKLRLIRCFLLPDKTSNAYCNRLLSSCVLTTRPDQGARVHVLPMAKVNAKCLPGYLAQFKHLFDRIVAYSPTGWTTTACGSGMSGLRSHGNANKEASASPLSYPLHKRTISDKVTLYEVPYSEHSAFSELAAFVGLLKTPVNVYPSVFNNYADRRRIDKQLKQWIK